MSKDSICQQFLTHYYQQFTANRAALSTLFKAESRMSFEGTYVEGTDAIMAKLKGLPFTKVDFVITTNDCHLVMNSMILIMVVGQLKTDDDPPKGFTQVFTLAQEQGSFFIMDTMFRLSLHNM